AQGLLGGVPQDEVGEQVGEGVGVAADRRAGVQDLGQRDALADQGGGDVQQAAADVDDLLAVGGQVAEFEGGGQVLRGDLSGEPVGEFLGGEADRGLLRGRAHAEEFADVPAVVEGL